MPCVCRRLTLSAWAIDVGSTGQLLYKADMTQNFLCQVKRKMLYTNSYTGVAQWEEPYNEVAGSSPAAGQLIGRKARNTIANVDNTGKLSARVFLCLKGVEEN